VLGNGSALLHHWARLNWRAHTHMTPTTMFQNIQIENSTLIAFGGLLAILAVTLWLALDTRRKWNRVFGKNRANIQDGFTKDVLLRLGKIETELHILEPQTAFFNKTSRASIQKIGFKRYNPFQDTGSDQSFSVALLDHHNTGVVISSLYLREGVRVYAKKIEEGRAGQALFNEEKEVLEEAIQES